MGKYDTMVVEVVLMEFTFRCGGVEYSGCAVVSGGAEYGTMAVDCVFCVFVRNNEPNTCFLLSLVSCHCSTDCGIQ